MFVPAYSKGYSAESVSLPTMCVLGTEVRCQTCWMAGICIVYGTLCPVLLPTPTPLFKTEKYSLNWSGTYSVAETGLELLV